MNKFIKKALLEKLSHEKAYCEFFDEQAWSVDWALKEMDDYDKL